jgi:MinD superfamily P-loop ATPase
MKDEHQHSVDEAAIRNLILTEWKRERIVNFATHLLGDKCQECAAKSNLTSELADGTAPESIFVAVKKNCHICDFCKRRFSCWAMP